MKRPKPRFFSLRARGWRGWMAFVRVWRPA